MFNIEEFKYRMRVARMSVGDVANLLGISKQAVYKKLKNASSWSIDEYFKIVDAFGLSPDDARAIFFGNKVGK